MSQALGKLLIFSGIVLVALGFVFILGVKLPFNIGRLPGDILIKKENFTFYFPITTCIIASIVLSLVFAIFFKK